MIKVQSEAINAVQIVCRATFHALVISLGVCFVKYRTMHSEKKRFTTRHPLSLHLTETLLCDVLAIFGTLIEIELVKIMVTYFPQLTASVQPRDTMPFQPSFTNQSKEVSAQPS